MTIFTIIVAGFFGTLAMTLTMGLIHTLGLANADMVRAIGSLYTRKLENAFWPGALVHFSTGCMFAFLYAIIGGYAPVQTGATKILIMTMAGTFHGLAMGLILTVAVAEYHPLEQFRKAGADVVVAHIVGHVAYGFFVGLIFAMARLDLHLMRVFS